MLGLIMTDYELLGPIKTRDHFGINHDRSFWQFVIVVCSR